ncbi:MULTISPECIES: hypothetical protein [unclassified Pseudomonas]|uniref:hypothetical protein n=1 Tax=unclassified Pseudomonas TaxID=196821 RepID=UPI000DB5CD2C|nr:hypothetical protein [Pseudomonas sp. URMO17WK12:I6]PZW56549.1 hypothetical protein F475_04567 [Pseudomonas sp. URMO17WK12:I6]
MNQPSSAFSVNTAHWGYIRPGLGRTGRSLSENNFAKERREWLSILLREVFQNALDARDTSAERVEVTLRNHPIVDNNSFLSELLPDEHLNRFNQSVPHLQQIDMKKVTNCLVVEDFGTSGLTGSIDNPELDGEGQNWNAFWFREGEGGKEHGSGNGGAGQGKITYFSTSGIRTIFGYTVRNDGKDEALFGASSFLRDYDYCNHKWKRDAYWGIWQGEGPDQRVLPIQVGLSIEQFREQLGIQRTSTQPGLSLVIPAPKVVNTADAIQITIAEFFVPIYQGKLIVNIEGTTIARATIIALADQHLSDKLARELHTCTTKGYRDFLVQAIDKSSKNEVVTAKIVDSANKITEANFSSDQLEEMRSAFNSEESIAVRFPLMIKPRKGGGAIECAFDVHLCHPGDLEMPEQAVIRRDLLIGEEPVGGGKLRFRARGLTLINDLELSKLLLSAEEATHLRWNNKLPRLTEYYRSGDTVVAIVRNAMVKLLDVLTEGDQKRDFKLLAKYFSAPGITSKEQTKGKKSPNGTQPKLPNDIPSPYPKLLIIEPLTEGCRIRPASAGALANAHLPLTVNVEFAYEGLDKDAFSEYDPLDFDLKDKIFTVTGFGYTILETDLNNLSFSIEDTDFSLTLIGFDKNLRLRIRLKYEEAVDATLISAQ